MGFEQIKVELQEWMGSDRKIAEAAWTSSYDQNKQQAKTDEDVEKVVRIMAESGHGTPFESVVMRFWIRLPIFTDRQHVTHRVGTHNGLSGRYRTMPDEFYHIPKDVEDILLAADIRDLTTYDQLCRQAYDIYNNWIDGLKAAQTEGLISNQNYKRAREVLRAVLPVGGMTERVSIFNLRSFSNYMRHRNSTHAQPEIQYVAVKMLEEVKAKKVAPIAIEELEKRQWLLEPSYAPSIIS